MNFHRIALIFFVLGACALAQSVAMPGQVAIASRTDSLSVVTQTNRELNTKKLKPGEAVSVKVIQALVLAGKVVIPRGAKLIGHVAELTPFTKNESQSRLALVFDRGKLKGGHEFSLRGYIQAVGSPLVNPELEAIMSSSPYSGAISGHSGSGGPMASAGAMTRSDVNGFQQREKPLETADYRQRREIAAQGALGAPNRGVFGLPGLVLDNSEPVPILVAAGKNIDLKEGTQIVLRLDDSLLHQ